MQESPTRRTRSGCQHEVTFSLYTREQGARDSVCRRYIESREAHLATSWRSCWWLHQTAWSKDSGLVRTPWHDGKCNPTGENDQRVVEAEEDRAGQIRKHGMAWPVAGHNWYEVKSPVSIHASTTPARCFELSIRRPWFPAFGGMTTFNVHGCPMTALTRLQILSPSAKPCNRTIFGPNRTGSSQLHQTQLRRLIQPFN